MTRKVIEGLSKNVTFSCDLNSWVYWKINGLIYSRDGLPDIYNIEGNNLILPNVDRTLKLMATCINVWQWREMLAHQE